MQDKGVIASGSRDTSIRLWPLSSDRKPASHVQTLTGHSDTVFSVVYLQDKGVIASRSRDTSIRLWSANESCTTCVPGEYAVNASVPCEDSPVGSVAPWAGSTNCISCVPGEYAVNASVPCEDCPVGSVAPWAGSTNCISCVPGEYAVNASVPCEDCPVGRYTAGSGQPQCSECARGSITAVSCSASCTFCPSGRFHPNNSLVCQNCSVGHYSSEVCHLKCTPCVGGVANTTGSTVCTPCAPGRFIAESGRGYGCQACPRGRGPTPNRTTCEDCTGIQCSSCGICKNCKQPNVRLDKATCVQVSMCQPGMAPIDGTASSIDQCADVRCQSCPPGTVNTDGTECVLCNVGNQAADRKQVVCESCRPGSEPATDRSRCIDCVGTNVSRFGAECVSCDSPNVVNVERSSCTPCPAGKGPNAERTACVTCTGATYSSTGTCVKCEKPYVVDNDQQSCAKCSPGHQPNANQTQCVSCEGTRYSQFGVECIGCADVVDKERTSCSKCQAGYGPNDNRTGCVTCTGATYVDCSACDCQGQVANAKQSACISCGAGKQPLSNRSQCADCVLANYSLSGVAHIECKAPSVVNGLRSSCTPSPAGKGPNAEPPGQAPNGNCTACVLCFGNSVATFGVCLPCDFSQEAINNKTQCVDVSTTTRLGKASAEIPLNALQPTTITGEDGPTKVTLSVTVVSAPDPTPRPALGPAPAATNALSTLIVDLSPLSSAIDLATNSNLESDLSKGTASMSITASANCRPSLTFACVLTLFSWSARVGCVKYCRLLSSQCKCMSTLVLILMVVGRRASVRCAASQTQPVLNVCHSCFQYLQFRWQRSTGPMQCFSNKRGAQLFTLRVPWLVLLLVMPTAAQPAGNVTTIAGCPRDLDGIGTSARFSYPTGVALSPDGAFALIADRSNHRIRKLVLATKAVTTLAGQSSRGFADAVGTSARFSSPTGVALSPDGAFALIADQYNHRIRKLVLATKAVTTLAGQSSYGFADAVGTSARFYNPTRVALSPDGAFALIADRSNHRIRKLVLATKAVTT
eukprot:COSAG05_NODE_1703_length_4249_cov_8.733735_1_plen_1033_part_10